MDYKRFLHRIENDKSFKVLVMHFTHPELRRNKIVTGSTASGMTTTLDINIQTTNFIY